MYGFLGFYQFLALTWFPSDFPRVMNKSSFFGILVCENIVGYKPVCGDRWPTG